MFVCDVDDTGIPVNGWFFLKPKMGEVEFNVNSIDSIIIGNG